MPNGIHRNCVVFDHSLYFGYENYVMALTLYADVMERLFAHDAERAFLANRAVAESTRQNGLVPFVWTGTDACDNRGSFVNPGIMEQIYFPHLQRALEPLHDAGITVVWHSDGNITPIAPALLRAGVDGFQGLQEHIDTRVDVAGLDSLRTRRGRRPVFVGSVASTVTMPFGTTDDVRVEVRRWQALAAARAAVFCSTSPHRSVTARAIIAEGPLHPSACTWIFTIPKNPFAQVITPVAGSIDPASALLIDQLKPLLFEAVVA